MYYKVPISTVVLLKYVILQCQHFQAPEAIIITALHIVGSAIRNNDHKKKKQLCT